MLGSQEPVIPPVAREFLSEQPWIVLGAADAHGRLWASPLYGEPGFITTPDESTVHIAAQPLEGDPLDRIDGAVGGLALEPATRRRMRLNGHATTTRRRHHDRARPGLLELPEVHRHPARDAARRTAPAARPRTRALLTRADTAFVATRAPEGADVSHRGGSPGFLRVDGDTVSWPDFQGNAMFNTLGNLVVDPACGLTVVDPEDGTTLYLTGHATVADDRRVTLHIHDAIQLENAAPLRWWLERPGRYPSNA